MCIIPKFNVIRQTGKFFFPLGMIICKYDLKNVEYIYMNSFYLTNIC